MKNEKEIIKKVFKAIEKEFRVKTLRKQLKIENFTPTERDIYIAWNWWEMFKKKFLKV